MMLVPYLWAQNPAADANLEPHTGWEYIIATPDAGSAYGYTINLFAEVETSYSVALNWGQPDDIASYEWTLDLLQATGFWEQCATSPAPVLTDFFMSNAMVSDDIYRQQGDAVLLASGDYCFAVAPYAAQVNGVDREGHFLFKMSPSDGSYELLEAVDFARTDLVDPCSADASMLLDTMFSTLGDDCATWLSLFASDAQYYHQHSGFDQGHEELLQGCQGYGSFCPA
jgi:hypothetical protein